MYIIERGEVGLYHSYSDKNDKETHINTLKVCLFIYYLFIYDYIYIQEGSICGDYEFFTKKSRMYTARSLTYSKAYVIYLKDFELLLNNSPEDFVNKFITVIFFLIDIKCRRNTISSKIKYRFIATIMFCSMNLVFLVINLLT